MLQEFSKLEKKEWIFIALLSLIPIALLLIYPVYVFLNLPPGAVFNGIRPYNFADAFVYFQYIDQIRDGGVLLYDYFTLEGPQTGVFNIVWVALGLLARLTGLSTPVIYYGSMVLLIPVAISVLFVFVKQFISEQYYQKLTTVLIALGSGIGIYAPFLKKGDDPNLIFGSVDLWQPESHLVSSMIHAPNFILSWILLLLSVWFIYAFLREGRYRSIIIAGLWSLVWFNFHPYYIPYMWLLVAVLFLVTLLRKELLFKKLFLGGSIYLLLTLPALAYAYYFTAIDPILSLRNAQNLTPSPPFIYFILGFGFFFILALPRILELIKKQSMRLGEVLLLTWALMVPVLVYLPFQFQRRLIMGWSIPLGILAVQYILSDGRLAAFIRRYARHSLIATILFMFLFSTSAVYYTIRDIMATNEAIAESSYGYGFHSADLQRVADHLKEENTELRGVIAPPGESILLAAFAGQRVYATVGHETINSEEKMGIQERFFADPDFDREAFLRDQGIGYIVVREEDKENFKDFTPIFTSGLYTLYSID